MSQLLGNPHSLAKSVTMSAATPAGRSSVARRFVALGDSFTVGLEDLGPDGRYRGWADIVAGQLA